MILLGDQVGQGDVCKSSIAERIADQEETFYGAFCCFHSIKRRLP